ncbi:MAG TPA: hypothetical protein VKB88_21520 [Bryobacteraceae bacterium]|nr:hypothetical protein [Bryobacteraceae bacterium]
MTQTKPWLDAMEDATKWLSLAVASAVPATTLTCLYRAIVEITRAIHALEDEREAREKEQA